MTKVFRKTWTDTKELPQERSVTQSAHEYLFETLRQFDNPCLRDFVLLADGNPYLLGVYARENATHLVMDALHLRARPVAPTRPAQYLQLSPNQFGRLDLYVVLAQDSAGMAEVVDAAVLPFADVHALPISFEPFANWASGGVPPSTPGTPLDTLQPTLGEILRLVFIHFASESTNRDGQDHSVEAEWRNSYDDDRRLAADDSELGEIESELQSYQDESAHSEDSGWYE